MIVILPEPFDYYEMSQPLYMQGSGHCVSSDVDDEAPEDAVRRIAEEVSGQDFSRPRVPMGFF